MTGKRIMEKLFSEKKNILRIVLLLVIPLIFALGVYLMKTGFSNAQTLEMLKRSEPLLLWLNLLCLAAGIWAARKIIAAQILSITPGSRKKIAAIFIAALLLRAFVAPHTHRLYYDEDIYLNIAQNMVHDGKAVGTNFAMFYRDSYIRHDEFLNKQPNAYPALVSVVFLIFGVSEKSALVLSIVLSSLTVLMVFLFTRMLWDERIALWSSLFYSLIPVAIVWAPTTSTEPPMVFFTILTMYLFALSSQEREIGVTFAAWMALAFTIQFRPEGVIFLLISLVFILFFDGWKSFREGRMILIFFLFCALAAHHALHVLSFLHENWGAVDKERFSTVYFAKNLKDNLGFFTRNMEFPVIFTLFALLGLGVHWKRWKEKSLMLLWIVAFFMPFLFFYAGSFCYGVDVRFSLLLLCPLSILCGCGMETVRRLMERLLPGHSAGSYLAIFLVLLFLPHLPYIWTVHEESWDARLDHDFIVRQARTLPADAVIFCHSPYVIILNARRGALQSYYGSDAKTVDLVFEQSDHVYFYRDYWCYAPALKQNYDFFCRNFIMEPVASAAIFERDYTLYRIRRK